MVAQRGAVPQALRCPQTMSLRDRLAAPTNLSWVGCEGTMARLRSGLQPAQTKPSRWQAVLGPAVAGFGHTAAWHCRCSPSPDLAALDQISAGIRETDAVATLEHPAAADGGCDGLFRDVIQVGRQHPPTGFAIHCPVQRLH
jgi:hypothetical protein